MKTTAQLLKQFEPKTQELEVKAWDTTVELRELSVSEFGEINSIIMGDSLKEEVVNGKISVSIKNAEKGKYTRVSLALVKPKLSVAELESMGESAIAGINEINEAIGKLNSAKK